MATSKHPKETPLMKQYNSIKAKYPDAMLLFRVGDFYETFGEDAVLCAQILNITLTKRGSGSASETALAGFPHHAINTYLPKLVKAGKRVAICDQLEDPKMTKKIVKRGVTELVTPGVSLNDEILEAKSNNYLCAIHYGKKNIGLSFIDISTGSFLIAQGDQAYASQLLTNLKPKEVLVERKHKKLFNSQHNQNFHPYYLDDWVFQYEQSFESLTQHFKVHSLKGFGIDQQKEGIVAAGVILHYLKDTHHNQLSHLTHIEFIKQNEGVWMDAFTIKNLELFPKGDQSVALLNILDETHSPMGGRLLKNWLVFPLLSLQKIEARQNIVKHFCENPSFHELTINQIQQISDLERLGSKLATGKINPRELQNLAQSILAIGPLITATQKEDNDTLKTTINALDPLESFTNTVLQTLNEVAPVSVNKGQVIAEKIDPELDELRQLLNEGKSFLDQMLTREMEATGIPSLKIAFNNVFGYYIEVRNTHKDKVPEHWIRKQTLVSAERYITEELKTYETKILGAEERIQSLEQKHFNELIQKALPYLSAIQKNAQIIASIDCLQSFASTALKRNYVKPKISEDKTIEILSGRHPVIENQLPTGEQYVANDVILNPDQQQIIMITGPNMSGKSALLRQTALICLLAQMGSYVPAKQAHIGLVDKIFTRVGASDNISMGESTFMVEMNETANILNNITDRSLVLLDEIGRGTSTYDGISIAWAIAEYLHEHPSKAKTLFATHYHELNEMTNSFSRIKNYNVSVKEMEQKIIFLRKLVPGGSEHSFGIHVAKLAGMPTPVLHRAEKILEKLEQSHIKENNKEQMKTKEDDLQLSFFQLDDPLLEEIKEEILHTNIDALTPIEALMKLNEIKRMLTKK